MQLLLSKLFSIKFHWSRIFDPRIFLMKRFFAKANINIKPVYGNLKLKTNYNTLKNAYFADKILKNINFDMKKKMNIMEIGAGAANLAIFLSQEYKSFNYFINSFCI